MKEPNSSAEGIEAKEWYTTSGIPPRREEKRREEKRREEDPPVTHRVKPPRRFYTSLRLFGEKITLNFPLSEKEIWTLFVAAMKRDGSSASAFFEKRLLEWYKGHAPGNPQTPLDRYGEEGDLGLGEPPALVDYKAEVFQEMTIDELLKASQDPILGFNEKRYLAWLIMEKRIRGGWKSTGK